jgi:hypothetical protein
MCLHSKQHLSHRRVFARIVCARARPLNFHHLSLHARRGKLENQATLLFSRRKSRNFHWGRTFRRRLFGKPTWRSPKPVCPLMMTVTSQPQPESPGRTQAKRAPRPPSRNERRTDFSSFGTERSFREIGNGKERAATYSVLIWWCSLHDR